MARPFRLNAHKCKCTHCDLIVLVEFGGLKFTPMSCPACQGEMKVIKGNITIVEE